MELNKAILNRWSPRGFSNLQATEEMIGLLFEAARKAPSSYNLQPWSYFYATRKNDKGFNALLSFLTGNNPGWAKEAQLLIVSAIRKTKPEINDANNRAYYDLGAANVSMAIQAAHMGLQVHQMGGFNSEKAAAYLKIDTTVWEPVVMIAVGFPPEIEDFREDQHQRLAQHNTRKNIEDFVFELK